MHRNSIDYYIKVIKGCNLISILGAIAQRSEEGILLQHSTAPSCLSWHLEGRLPIFPPQTLKTDLWVRDSWIRSALHGVKRLTEISCWWISIVSMWSTPGLDELLIPYGLNHLKTLPLSKCSFFLLGTWRTVSYTVSAPACIHSEIQTQTLACPGDCTVCRHLVN